MIALDSSVLVAILLDEPEADAFIQIVEAVPCCLSAFTLFEASTVLLGRSGPNSIVALDQLITRAKVEVIAYDRQHAHHSRTAYHRFGKGFHPAALNLGDCVSYSLAKSLDAPLLFKGDDFAKTDVQIWRA